MPTFTEMHNNIPIRKSANARMYDKRIKVSRAFSKRQISCEKKQKNGDYS